MHIIHYSLKTGGYNGISYYPDSNRDEKDLKY